MRPVRFMAIAAVCAVALTACGQSDDSSSSTSTSGVGAGTVASSPQQDNTKLEAPQPPATKWRAAGDLCKLIPSEKAAEILGQPVTQHAKSKAPSDPRVIDECNYSYLYEGKPNDRYEDDKVYVANILVFRDGDEVVKFAERVVAERNFKLTEYQVSGFDRAFYTNSEANVLDDNVLVAVNNGATGKFEPAVLIKFAALAHKAVNNR